MAVMPGCDFRNIADSSDGLMSRYDIVCIHTLVGYAPGGDAAHWSVGAQGYRYQWRDTRFQSAANYQGNHRVLAIENEDHGDAFGAWNVNDGHAVPGFTANQMFSIAEILVWANKTHGVPLALCPDSKPGSRGIAYHRQGCDSPNNFAGYAYPGRVPGGEVWTRAYGKVCPGDRRIKQLIEVIIPRARALAGLEKDNDMTPDEMKFDVLAGSWRFDGRNPVDMWREATRSGLAAELLSRTVNQKVDTLSATVARLETVLSDVANTVAKVAAGNVDYATLAKAVNDDQAKRLAE